MTNDNNLPPDFDGPPLENPPEDPFSPHNLAISQFIVSCRIYDVLMAQLQSTAPGVAQDLLELHRDGSFVGPQPAFNGTFLTDELNEAN